MVPDVVKDKDRACDGDTLMAGVVEGEVEGESVIDVVELMLVDVVAVSVPVTLRVMVEDAVMVGLVVMVDVEVGEVIADVDGVILVDDVAVGVSVMLRVMVEDIVVVEVKV